MEQSGFDIDGLLERALYRGPTVTADQLIGVDACLRQLGGQLALVARPELAAKFGIQASGTLFIGPPGTGKTLLARYLAGRLGIPLYQISADELGDNPDNGHELFRRLGNQRAVLFIDEVSILAQRREWSDASDRRMLAALLTSLDGLATAQGPDRLWVIGACTPDIQLDHAVYRAGRLGVVIEFAAPSEEQRRDLLRLYLAPVPHSLTDDDVARLAEMANGATGADIRDWVSQAASEVLSEAEVVDEPVIDLAHIERVVIRRGFVAAEGRPGRAPDWETAVHESAHAVIAHALFGRDALAKVSVGFQRHGRRFEFAHLGHFELSDEWRQNHPPTSTTWREHVSVHLAGACAEEAILGYRGGGADVDVTNATNAILDQFNEGDPVFGPSRAAIEANSGVPNAAAGSEPMRRLTWQLTRSRFDVCWDRTAALVADHRSATERLATVLLESKQTLTGDEIIAVVGASKYETPQLRTTAHSRSQGAESEERESIDPAVRPREGGRAGV